MADERVTVREALARYQAENGFKGDAMSAETIQVRVFGELADIPNPVFQRPLLARHDLHHVLTEYGTDWLGEAEMGAWEIGAGPGHWFVWLNNIGALLIGVVAPWRTLRAWWRGRACRSLYRDPLAYEVLIEMRLDELRERVGLSRCSDRRDATSAS